MKKMKPLPRDYLTTREAAEALNVSVRTVQLWVENGRLSAWKTVGGHRRIDPVSVKRLADEQQSERRHQIVLVEDEGTQRKLIARYLTHMNLPIDVHTAVDGFHGLLLIGQIEPDLVITDLVMPGMDGFRMLKAIDEADMPHPTEVIILTALEHEGLEDSGAMLLSNTILYKPVEFAVLEQAVKEKLSAVGNGKKPAPQ